LFSLNYSNLNFKLPTFVLLSIIIINYKTPKLILDCLTSIYQFSVEGIEIIVVDNNSEDDIGQLLSLHYPKISFLQMGYNAGFARANNEGIRIAKGENILLLNSDTINLNDAINKCDNLLRNSEFVAAGVQLLNDDLTPQISGNFVMKGGLNYLLPLPYLGKWLKFIADILKIEKPSIAETKCTIEIDWINGAFLMVKKSAIDKAGLLDEDFFLYAEESEWCSRIRKHGKLCIFGELNILHLQGESSNTAFKSAGKGYFNLFDRKGLQIILSNWVRIRKQFGIGWFVFILIIYYFTIPLFFIAVLINSISKNSKYSFFHFIGFSKNLILLFKFIPIIILNKPYFYKVL
jgi:GT2 family glycosyltransferase